ncbi:REPEAT-CONTAINING PROTEIN putative-RELATED [Salix koriyanagi]|uniref:REPEAT-CONTAINING PROTEIN putative-RELATED n=1 Tax=Salix koriyanagi TaxID=2511006 RepID=A0A9Q0VI23_9ROSI|nr:REPEAT-CONTAINING PROTEIN putative-RELATED [Salix koriyanagi]
MGSVGRGEKRERQEEQERVAVRVAEEKGVALCRREEEKAEGRRVWLCADEKKIRQKGEGFVALGADKKIRFQKGAREICHTLLKRCANLNKLNDGKIIHALLLNSRFSDDLVMQNTLLNMYAKCGDLVNARKLFDEMSIRDVVTWTALITGYSQHDGPQAALLLLPEMLRIGLKPNQFTLASLLKAASGVGSTDVLQGRQLHGLCLKCGYDSNVYVSCAILDMYARCDHLEEAQLIFDVMHGVIRTREMDSCPYDKMG